MLPQPFELTYVSCCASTAPTEHPSASSNDQPIRTDVTIRYSPLSSNDTIHPCEHALRTVLPLRSLSMPLAPACRRMAMIFRCSSRATSEPDPRRPVSCTARCNGVEPLPFCLHTSAPPFSNARTASEER